MNFKERIQIINQSKSEEREIKDLKEKIETLDVFVKNKTVDRILQNAVFKSKNIILLSPIDCDKLIVSNYIRNFIQDDNIDVISSMASDMPHSNSKIALVPKPSLNEGVKIFELILCDYKSFVFALNLKTYTNVLESLRTLVSLNKPNLAKESVEHLIGVSEALLVYVSKNDDGLFEITDVGKIVYKNNAMFLDVVYSNSCNDEVSFSDVSVNSTPVESVETPSFAEEKPVEEVVDDDLSVSTVQKDEIVVEQNIENAIADEEIVETSEVVATSDDKVEFVVQEEILPEQEELAKKVNKYKALKEKIKAKKQILE